MKAAVIGTHGAGKTAVIHAFARAHRERGVIPGVAGEMMEAWPGGVESLSDC